MSFATVEKDIVYGDAGNRPLRLDLYRPVEGDGPWPVILWIHGGAWRQGSKDPPNLQAVDMVKEGYAVASVGYRLTDEAIFPAQIFDCKAAVRWVRAKGRDYGLDAERLGVWGSSAGGHLVSLLGTSGDVPELEGHCGHPGFGTRVQAVCDWFGPSDLIQMGRFPSHMDHDAPDSPESQLLGGPVQEMAEAATLANPITYIYGDEPPFLIMHGDADMTVPCSQSLLLHQALTTAGVESTLHLLPGGGHGGAVFETDAVRSLVVDFFRTHLRP